MSMKKIGIIMHGATGRICSTQHIHNALIPIISEGGFHINSETIIPRLLLVGRNKTQLEKIAKANNIREWTTNLDSALSDKDFSIFFEAAATHQRLETLNKAITAEKHIYTEKPIAPSVSEGLHLLKRVENFNLKHGAVEDKLYLPGFQKLTNIINDKTIGEIVCFRLEFGWWVFNGNEVPSQRPSWNYKKETGGGLFLDMHTHWRYVIENILGKISKVVSTSWIAQPERIDENGHKFSVDVEDTTHTLLELENGVSGSIFSSWATRVRRDDLVCLYVDGTKGSAICGLRDCWVQDNYETPIIKGFDIGHEPNKGKTFKDYASEWKSVDDHDPFKNPYRVGWEHFLSHVIANKPLRSSLKEGIKDIQLAESCIKSSKEKVWINIKKI